MKIKTKGQRPRQRQRQRFTLPEEEELSKQEWAAKALKDRIKAAEKDIREIQKRYPEKSRIQLLRRIYLELGAFAAELEIARIERNQGDRLSIKDHLSIEEDKIFIRQRRPASKDCPCRS